MTEFRTALNEIHDIIIAPVARAVFVLALMWVAFNVGQHAPQAECPAVMAQQR